MPTTEPAQASTPQQLRSKLLTPRRLKSEEITVEHPDGNEKIFATELPWPNLKQYQEAVKAQPERSDELLAINALITPNGDTILTTADVAAFDEMPGTLALSLIEPCKRVNGK